MAFYRNVRPWGFWKPILAKVKALDPNFVANADFKRDAVNVIVGTIWQTALVALPIYIVLLQTAGILACLAVIAASSYFLKKNWYERLDETSRSNVQTTPVVQN